MPESHEKPCRSAMKTPPPDSYTHPNPCNSQSSEGK